METEKILNIPVDNISCQDIVTQLPDYLMKKQKMTITSVNPQIILGAQKYPMILNYIEKSTHRIPDGIGIVLVSKLTKGKIRRRVAGYDLMIQLLQFANDYSKKIFIYGAEKTVLSDAVKRIELDYPNVEICGAVDGFTELTNKELIEKINKQNCDILFVGMGFPKQELWLAENIASLNPTVYQDVGGSIDVISGHVKRAPDLFIKLNLEWLYRSFYNPKRIYRILQLPLFLSKSLWWAWTKGEKKSVSKN
ncbi:WecB/TagA/CpsF family glycosyltransferase [Enterococcus casseliflavus]|uniref:WecB/TagA/CpsF family glycosyltransferase n=1 Tax=Enterococcus TaxID=1350 RepID=UPI00112B58CA|nr:MULTISPECIES: WecB/TagA/CpsF family glycosyltransferase [Enterococcus]MBW9322319.1 WecB/TagA/CpsF family glycosyltransferase [Enterococcus casseliflavus]TPR57937.1 WecB/TagA/CpsF family glycosyltransferase [Enterococcus sp. OL5]